jgi:hypothetical protein
VVDHKNSNPPNFNRLSERLAQKGLFFFGEASIITLALNSPQTRMDIGCAVSYPAKPQCFAGHHEIAGFFQTSGRTIA